ncbi:MAG TPA: TIGR04222 domain-containing membrane protein [Acidimicrobiia bacterium]|nr:TIGR04222 domain-containing membrane protein [Acidimicrobiia bacterium]
MGGLEAEFLGSLAVLALCMAVTLAARIWFTRPAAAPGTDLSLYQVAMLAGGAARVSDTALAYLTWSGMIEIRESTDRLVRIPGMRTVPDLHPVESSILAAVDASGVRPEAAMGAGRQAAREAVALPADLGVAPKLLLALDLMAVGGSGLVASWVAWWTLSRDGAATGFVPLIGVLAVLYSAWWMFSGRPRITGAGAAGLESIRRQYDSDLALAAVGVTSLPAERAMHVIALYGRDALTGGLSGLRKVMTGNPAPVLTVKSSLVR